MWLEIGEIEDDALVVRNEGAHAVEENIGDAGDELAVAADDDDLSGQCSTSRERIGGAAVSGMGVPFLGSW